jgi:S-adenosylmethionine hydrolase
MPATYGDVADQTPLAYTESSGMVEIAIRNGNAALMLGLKDEYTGRAESFYPAVEKP